MIQPAISAPVALSAGEAQSTSISVENYLEHYAENFYEWVGGEVIKMPPVTSQHDELTGYSYQLSKAYLAINPIGIVKIAPFVMKVDPTRSGREPDLQIILKSNPGNFTETAMLGPADICIEIVSEGSVARDYGDKFEEYEKGGVREYWVFDSLRKMAFFYRLNEAGFYQLIAPDENGNYRTPLLPKLVVHVPTLWQENLPDFFAIGEAVKSMFAE